MLEITSGSALPNDRTLGAGTVATQALTSCCRKRFGISLIEKLGSLKLSQLHCAQKSVIRDESESIPAGEDIEKRIANPYVHIPQEEVVSYRLDADIRTACAVKLLIRMLRTKRLMHKSNPRQPLTSSFPSKHKPRL